MSERDDIFDIHLSALVDGELGRERRAELERAIGADAGLAARFDEMRTHKQMLRRLFDPVAQRPIPEEWLAQAYAPPRARRWRVVAAIAAAVLVAVIATKTWIDWRPAAPGSVVDEALDARALAIRPEKTIAVGQGVGLARYDAMLKNIVGARVRVPNMMKAGYRLTAIRLFAHEGGRAAELSYRDARDHVFTLYVSRSDGAVDFVQLERRGLRVCLWRDDTVSTVMAGNVSTAVMQRLAILAYAGMTA